jgi:type VI secretion system secreted protein VgrG
MCDLDPARRVRRPLYTRRLERLQESPPQAHAVVALAAAKDFPRFFAFQLVVSWRLSRRDKEPHALFTRRVGHCDPAYFGEPSMASPADPRGISVQTPLGPDALFLTGFRGREGLSQLFHFQLELMAENRQAIAFDKLIGQKITFSILLPDGKTKRFFNGICSSLAQDGRDSTFTTYRMEVVPQFWLLTRRTQCRIFQHLSVPDILKKVLTGLDIKLELQGTFEPRDYCVQYRESDFAFASRLMEEEGIYYFFKHTDGGHQMILGNTPATHAAVAFSEKAIYEELEGGNRPDMRVSRWEKVQELRSGKVTLWDHCFELPHQHLDAERPTQESVAIGKVTHKLKLAANEPLEVYDYPGAYAQRFDGIDAGGGDRPADLTKIFQDNKRTAAIRMEQEAVQAITIRGSGNCRQFMAGHKFTLERHYDGDGAYVLTSVEHNASASAGGRSGEGGDGVSYQNHFTCIPLALPFRPPQTTDKPVIPGPQTAVVVGPPGEIIFCDKYGRIKVQFHWDRQGKMNPDSSCWIRVSSNWGGANWGGMFIPHVKQEVIVEFEEGDPDRPLVTGRVYNAECMPPLELPANKTKSVIRDHGGNEIVMEGEKGKEQIRMFSPYAKTSFRLGAPNSKVGCDAKTEGDYVVHADGDERHTVGKNYELKILENWSEFGKGWVHKNYVGLLTQILLGGKIDNITPFERKHILGWTQASIVGFKREVIGGAQTSILGGKKNETIRGSTVKLHVGKATEYRNTALDEKTPSKRELSKVAKLLHNEASEIIDGQKKVKTGGEMYEKGNKMFMEAKTIAELKAGSKMRMEASDLKFEGKMQISKCSSYSTEAGKYVVNNGAFAVK